MDPYGVLGISSGVTEQEVRSAYKAMAKMWHPDRRLNDQETATKKFKEASYFLYINTAYRDILRQRRREARKVSSKAPPPSPPPPPPASSSTNSANPQNTNSASLNADRIDPSSDLKTKAMDPADCMPDASVHMGNETKNVERERGRDTDRKHCNEPSSPNKSTTSRLSTAKSSKSSSASSSSSLSSSTSSHISSSIKSSSISSRTSIQSKSSSMKSAVSKDYIAAVDDTPVSSSNKILSDENQNMDHSVDSTLGMPPLFASSTSSEVSAYDNPEIILSTSATNAHLAEIEEVEVGEDSNNLVDDLASPTTPPPPARPPEDAKSKSNRRDAAKKLRKDSEDREHEERTLIPEFDSPLARSFGVNRKWTYTIRLTLEELFRGKKLRFRVMRCKLDGKRKTVLLDVDIPPGSSHGTQIIFKGAGHERKNGTRQNIQFILEEEKHEKFVRLKDDLALDARLPWVESLKTEKGVVHVKGIDGVESRFEVDYMGDGDVTGTAEIPGAGMPILGTNKRGKLIVRWEIFMPAVPTRWNAVKRALHL